LTEQSNIKANYEHTGAVIISTKWCCHSEL